MPYGQSGFVGAGAVGPFLGGTLGGIAGDFLEDLLGRLLKPDAPSLPQIPGFPFDPGTGPQLPQLPPGIPGLSPPLGGACPSLFRTGGPVSHRARPADVVCLQNPLSGEAEFFGSLGKPLVFQRDVRMAKNIPKLIRKLGGHTSHRSKR